jgi:hypothetical protein
VSIIAQRDLWRERHRFCTDTPMFDSFDEARYILGEHAGHGGSCLQYVAALSRTTEMMA